MKPDKNLVSRCHEVLNWKRTGRLEGSALRELASTIQPKEYALRIAETQTADEAMRFVIMVASVHMFDTQPTAAKGGHEQGS